MDTQEHDVVKPTSLANLAQALSAAQGKFKKIEKNKEVTITSKRTNSQYKFRYADLESLIEATRPALSENGLCVMQVMDGANLTTILAHSSGEKVESVLQVKFTGDADIKDFGARISYIRRYQYQSILCLAADDDIDRDEEEQPQKNDNQIAQPQKKAEAKQAAANKKPEPEPQARREPEPDHQAAGHAEHSNDNGDTVLLASTAQKNVIKRGISKKPNITEDDFLAHHNIQSFDDMQANDIPRYLQWITAQ